jgi:ABC-type phosphate transport system substrate-binding protein
MTGSTLGLLKLKEGFADVAFVTQTLEGNPAMDGLAAIPLGFWGLYFAVQEDNPLNEVEIAVLSEIMRKTRDGLKSEWGSLLPKEPKWSNRLVFVTFDIQETDPSYPVLLNQFFEDEVLEKFSSMGERIENPYLSSASNLLVMSKLPIPGKGLRSLALIESGQTIGYPPSAESMYFGDYPLSLSLYLLVRDVTDPKVRGCPKSC